MGAALFRLEDQLSAGAVAEAAETGTIGFAALAQAGENFADYIIELVGGFGGSNARLARHNFRDGRLFHTDFTLAGKPLQGRSK